MTVSGGPFGKSRNKSLATFSVQYIWRTGFETSEIDANRYWNFYASWMVRCHYTLQGSARSSIDPVSSVNLSALLWFLFNCENSLYSYRPQLACPSQVLERTKTEASRKSTTLRVLHRPTLTNNWEGINILLNHVLLLGFIRGWMLEVLELDKQGDTARMIVGDERLLNS